MGFDAFFIMANQVWYFKVEITIFRILFKHWIHIKFQFPAVQKNSQKKRDQMKILHLYDAKVLFHFVRHVSPAMKPERRLKLQEVE